MLSMDDIKYIRRMFECEDVSVREIMRRTGYHDETVRIYWVWRTLMSLSIHRRSFPLCLIRLSQSLTLAHRGSECPT